MSYYQCVRCDYVTKRNSDMIRHLGRTRKCPRSLQSYKYTDDEIQELSLILHRDPNIKQKDKIILKKDNIECPNCKKTFSRKDNLNTHLRKTCKNIISVKNDIDINKEESTFNKIKDAFKESAFNKNTFCHKMDNSTNGNTNIQNNVLNIENQTNIENHTNNIIILNPSLQPFDNQWSTEHIDKYISQVILLSENKYTNLLGEILKNKENLNVILDKNSPYGLVYKNDNDMYVNMKVNEIIEQSMKKLYQQLNLFYANFASNDILKINRDIIEKEKKQIENKFNDYCNNKNDVKQIVENLLEDIYEKNKAEAVEIAEKMLTYKNSIDNKIGY